jgi:transcriptional regulator with XRE-family HTH domain
MLGAMQRIEVAFGQAVRRRRLQLGLSQEVFADRAKIHRTYVGSIELGKVQVSIRITHQLAIALEIPLSRLGVNELAIAQIDCNAKFSRVYGGEFVQFGSYRCSCQKHSAAPVSANEERCQSVTDADIKYLRLLRALLSGYFGVRD